MNQIISLFYMLIGQIQFYYLLGNSFEKLNWKTIEWKRYSFKWPYFGIAAGLKFTQQFSVE